MPCFTAGAHIATPGGQRLVETIRAGDEVLTASGAAETVVWVGSRRLPRLKSHPAQHSVQPIRVVAGAFAPAVPVRDLVLSPGHAVHVDGVLIPLGRLVNGRSVIQLERDEVEYFHIELRRHDVLLAEGLTVESYLDCGNRSDFEGAASTALHPRFTALAHEAACAPLVVSGRLLERVRARLIRRARAIRTATNARSRRFG